MWHDKITQRMLVIFHYLNVQYGNLFFPTVPIHAIFVNIPTVVSRSYAINFRRNLSSQCILVPLCVGFSSELIIWWFQQYLYSYFFLVENKAGVQSNFWAPAIYNLKQNVNVRQYCLLGCYYTIATAKNAEK